MLTWWPTYTKITCVLLIILLRVRVVVYDVYCILLLWNPVEFLFNIFVLTWNAFANRKRHLNYVQLLKTKISEYLRTNDVVQVRKVATHCGNYCLFFGMFCKKHWDGLFWMMFEMHKSDTFQQLELLIVVKFLFQLNKFVLRYNFTVVFYAKLMIN